MDIGIGRKVLGKKRKEGGEGGRSKQLSHCSQCDALLDVLTLSCGCVFTLTHQLYEWIRVFGELFGTLVRGMG